MNDTKLKYQINQYASLIKKLKQVQAEANFIRNKIAETLINNDTDKFYRITFVKVRKHWVKRHLRLGSSHLRLSRNGVKQHE